MSLRKPLMLVLFFVLFALAVTINSARAAEGCQMQLSPPVMDYGTLNPDELRFSARKMAGTTASLGKRRMRLSIVCDEARVMNVAFRSLALGAESYQFGANGRFSLVVRSAQLDGVSVLAGTISAPGNIPVASGSAVALKPGQYVVPVQNQHAASGKNLMLDLEMEASLTTDALKVRDDMRLEGRGYFDLG